MRDLMRLMAGAITFAGLLTFPAGAQDRILDGSAPGAPKPFEICQSTCTMQGVTPVWKDVCRRYVAGRDSKQLADGRKRRPISERLSALAAQSAQVAAPQIGHDKAAVAKNITNPADMQKSHMAVAAQSTAAQREIAQLRQACSTGRLVTFHSISFRDKSPNCWVPVDKYCVKKQPGDMGWTCQCGTRVGRYG